MEPANQPAGVRVDKSSSALASRNTSNRIQAPMEPETENLDVVVIGAGLSGINTAYRLKTQLPHHSYAILEARAELGGTWAFWKYPGIRTDSSMGLFGFSWRPWPHEVNMAPAPAIKQYMEECAAAEGIDKKIRLRHRVVVSSWSSQEQRWTLQVDAKGEDGTVHRKVIKAWWVINASGYYSYEKPLPAVIPGIERFGGQVVHPQFWDEKVNYSGKKVVIIGSGATAITLLPALAKTSHSVTMLQRSPSYVMSLPSKNSTSAFLSKYMPSSWAAQIHWWLSMLIETLFVGFLKTFPQVGRRFIMSEMRNSLPKDFDIDKHFNPRYNPFEQRLCFCPGADFFKALHRPNTRVVTDNVETVTETGILLKSGETLEADMIITATGLYFSLLSSVKATVDGESVNDTLGTRYIWNGVMLEGVPNSGLISGYTAATWTPGADARVRQLIKVIKYMDKVEATMAMPCIEPAERAQMPVLPGINLSSTYVVSAMDRLPKIAGKAPWVNGSNWAVDMWRLMTSNVREGMRYTFADKKGI
ncbi:FAD/NAD(P)-binding domain-containing protein [Parathielavia appendiculata]|uniref:FAD/NAD(P)-binding domain-containing protein n=1 Tax=Parathielavia appendiculata TaxID=2587402 RepID=A0AAN6Z965_9PEZI|nr:FAD/NAD(P)-binding domain-containing protein [Parathielavia appendiculata]